MHRANNPKLVPLKLSHITRAMRKMSTKACRNSDRFHPWFAPASKWSGYTSRKSRGSQMERDGIFCMRVSNVMSVVR